jgi:hypothetical protein
MFAGFGRGCELWPKYWARKTRVVWFCRASTLARSESLYTK